jgi:hypothetical protein
MQQQTGEGTAPLSSNSETAAWRAFNAERGAVCFTRKLNRLLVDAVIIYPA